MLFALAWRNLWRRPQCTVLSLLSIALVSTLLICMLSFQISVYGVMKETTLRIFSGYAQFQPRGYADDPGLERTIARPEDLARQATMIDGVTAAAPRVNGFAILANGERSYGAAVVGVDPASEARLSSIRSMIREGRYLAPGDSDTAILGDILARNLAVAVGSKVTVLGSGRDGSVSADVLRVVGIYHSGIPELDRSILEMPLARAQETFAMSGFANTIALSGPTLGGVNNAIPALDRLARRQGVIVRDWGAMEPAMRDGITLKIATSMLFYVTLVVVVAFIILNTLLMSVLERTREFGMLAAMGMQPHMIGRIPVGRRPWGIAVSRGITLWLENVGVVIPGLGDLLAQFGLPPRLYPALSPVSALIGPGAIFLAILLGGVVPYLRVVRLTPALAMRSA